MKIFAERLTALRQEKELSQTKLAEELEVSKSIVSYWENDVSEPTITNLYKIAVFFDVSSDYLIGLENE